MKRKAGSPTPIPTPTPVALPLVKCTYFRNSNTVIGNNVEENAYLAKCQAQGINTLYVYDMSAVLAVSYTAFAAFYTKALSYGITNIAGFRGSQSRLIGTAFNSNRSYNQSNFTKRIFYSLEDEFWNYDLILGTETHHANQAAFPVTGLANHTYNDDSDNTSRNSGRWIWINNQYERIKNHLELFDLNQQDAQGDNIYRNWIKELSAVYTQAKADGLICDFYIGHMKDDIEETPSIQITKAAIMNSDRTHISWYVSDEEYNSSDAGLNYMATRFNLFGQAVQELIAEGKKPAGYRHSIIFIFGGTPEMMEDTFLAGTKLLTVFNRCLGIYNNNPGSTLTHNQYLYVAGFNSYDVPGL